MRRSTAALITATTLSAGTLSALAVTSTSVSAAAPGAGVYAPALSIPTQNINTVPAASSVSMKTYSYGSHSRNVLDVLASSKVAAASSSVRRPTVLLVHGGSWVKGDKSQMRDAAKDLVGEGYVAIPINYRYATQAGWPAQREDLQTALRWVRNNAAKLHVNTNKIVVVGSSAGAEITASALTQGDGSKLARGMALLSGPLDLALVASDTSNSSAVTLGKRVTDDLLRCLPTNCKSELRERSAAYRHDSRDPASLVVFSKGDWVDPRSSYRFHEAARHDGVRSELKAMSGSKHGMKAWDQAWPTIKSWIARRMVPKH